MRVLCLLFFLFLFLITSCENPVVDLSDSVIYPIAAGNYWKYKIYTYSDGEILPNLTDSLFIIIDKEINVNLEGKTYKGGIEKKKFGENTYTEARWIYTNLNNGLYYLGGLNEKDTIFQKFMFLKYPVKQGETWDVPYMYYDLIKERFEFKPDSTEEFTCISENQKIPTEIGEFNCVVYHFKAFPEKDVPTYWHYYINYSPEIGYIGTEIRSSFDNRMIQKIIIVDYKIR